MKKYISPIAKCINIEAETLLAQSGGVDSGSTFGNGYNEDDVTCSNRRSIWGDTEW